MAPSTRRLPNEPPARRWSNEPLTITVFYVPNQKFVAAERKMAVGFESVMEQSPLRHPTTVLVKPR